ncbi:hypothetical protein EMIT047CA2_90181 [Pseudomonas soli]
MDSDLPARCKALIRAVRLSSLEVFLGMVVLRDKKCPYRAAVSLCQQQNTDIFLERL